MKITALPAGTQFKGEQGQSLLEVLQQGSLLKHASCGGQGVCGKCKVRLLSTDHGEPDDTELAMLSSRELADGWRLACRFFPKEDITIALSEQVDTLERKKSMIRLPEDFLSKRNAGIGHGITQDIPKAPYGVAFDIGTTTVVGMLWDLKAGVLVDAASRTNPQTSYGADVISRILYTMEEDGNLDVMQESILACVREILKELLDNNQIDDKLVDNMTFVGNTTMSHLLLGENPSSLAVAPFTPSFHGPVTKTACDLSLPIKDDSKVYILSNIAGHVGSDITGVLLATDLSNKAGVHLAIDIGTNGEILASKEGRVLACSTAAGPAFEGASIRFGMRAAEGAIEAVGLGTDDLFVKIIGEKQPKGICGSGLIDAVAVLLHSGLLSNTGKLSSQEEALKKGTLPKLAERIQITEFGPAFVLAYGIEGEPDVVLTQKDIREVQLAKGAILAGMDLLLKELHATPEELKAVYLAGAFGNYINVQSALAIGLLPTVPYEVVHSIGNAAGVGASMALLSNESFQESTRLALEAEHVDLVNHPLFQEYFMKAMYFKA